MHRQLLWALAAACLAYVTLSPPLPHLPGPSPPAECRTAVADMGSLDSRLRVRSLFTTTGCRRRRCRHILSGISQQQRRSSTRSSAQLRVVTLNTWGLWLVSRRREERMAALADWLRRYGNGFGPRVLSWFRASPPRQRAQLPPPPPSCTEMQP